MMVREVSCKIALSRSGLPEFDYVLNPYSNCEHACTYCYAPSIVRLPRDEWGTCVHVKKNIPAVLAKELKRKKKGLVGISTVTDAYQPAEERFEVTRRCLEQLLRYDFPVSIITKSHLVARDIDLLVKFSSAEVGFTITTPHDEQRQILESNSPSIPERLDGLKKCSDAGIITYMFIGPLYPMLQKEDLELLVSTAKEKGAGYIMADRLNLKPGVWDAVYARLGEEERTLFKARLFTKKQEYSALFSELERICLRFSIRYKKQKY